MFVKLKRLLCWNCIRKILKPEEEGLRILVLHIQNLWSN
jgi:hypothetical protein